MRKIVFFDVHGDDKRYFKRTFKEIDGCTVTCTEEPLTPATVGRYPGAAIVSVFMTSEVTQEVIAALPDLEMVATRSTGYDHIDTSAARQHKVLVSTVPTYGEVTVAEFTILLLLAVARRLPEGVQQVHERLIDYDQITGFDLAGKTLGLIGCGRIGRHVAQIAQGLGMRVIGFDPVSHTSDCIEYVSLPELYVSSDIISLHAPGGRENHHIIDASSFARMKKGVIIINTARGELIDTQALVDSLFSGQVGAAGLDVLEGEELLRYDEEISLLHPNAKVQDLLLSAEHNALLRMPNVIITPHTAFNSREARQRIRHTTADNIKKYLEHSPQNLV